MGKPLECPLTVLGGASDPAISKTMLAGWQKNTAGAFAQYEFEGGHFYIHPKQDEVVSVVIDCFSD